MLALPDGQRIAVAASPAQPQYLPLDQAGIYRLALPHAELCQAANVRRPADDATFSPAAWEGAHPRSPVRWLTAADRLLPTDFLPLRAAVAADKAAMAYDLTPLAVVLFLFAALGEGMLLLLAWKDDRQ